MREEFEVRGNEVELRNAGSSREIFDNIARILGSDLSRRKVFGLAVKGLIGAALAEVGIRTAWAAATCPCPGSGVYDPLTACCTSLGVQPKNPIANLAACPNKVKHVGNPSNPNGCGGEGGVISPYIPNRWGLANFLPCCNTHDNCYGNCNSVKTGCDNSFGACLIGACASAYGFFPSLFGSCSAVAGIYFAAVRFGGQSFYDAGQMQDCDCCSSTTCPQSCVGGTCASLPACGDPGCVCFQTVEGTGFCHRSQSCAGLATCSSSASCPAGWACVNVTCCGGTPVCIRPCFVISGALAEAPLSGPTTIGNLGAGSGK